MAKASKGFRVFLSYNSRDREIVETIARGFRLQGLDIFFDQWSLPVGHPWPEKLEHALASCHGVIVFLGRQALGPWQQKEVGLALERQVRESSSFPVVPVLLPGADPPLSFLFLNTWIDCRNDPSLGGLTERLVKALHFREPGQQRARPKAQPKEIQPQSLETSPYRGLFPFREEDASLYYGREPFVLSIRAAVERNSLTALVGASGSGKSSLVHAGLLPELRSNAPGFWQAVSIRPGPHPISSLASGLIRLLEPRKTLEEQKSAADRLMVSLMRGEESLESLSLKAHQETQRDGLLLLVVDQWEELYTLAQDEAEQARFIEEILAATRANSISVLVLFRADFYSNVMEHPEIRRRLQGDCLIPIPDMSPDDLRRAVEEPARKVGLEFDNGLVDRILMDVERQPGQLPLLQFALSRLWSERSDGRLLYSSYTAMRGLEGALARTADEITRELQEPEVRRLFLRLVRVVKDAPVTRRRASSGELDQETYKVSSRFIEEGLLTRWDAKTGDEIIEIAHEALIHHWQRFRAWLEESRAFLLWRELLEPDLAAWLESGQKEPFLLTAGPLQVAEYWFRKNGKDLSPEAYGYIRLGLEKRERDQLRRRSLLTAAAFLVMVLIGLGARLIYLRAAQAYARSAALSAEATRLADRKLDLALLLALQATKVRATAEARGVMLSLTAGNPALRHFLRPPAPRVEALGQSRQETPGAEILGTAFGPSGLLASGGNGKVFLWDAKQGKLRVSLEAGAPADIVSLAFNPAGTLLAAGSETAGLIRLWNLNNVDEPVEVDPIRTNGSSQNLAFSPGGNLLAWSTPSGVYVWDLSREVLIRQILRNPILKTNWISGLAFGPAGELASATADGQIQLRRSGSEKPLWSTLADGLVLGLAFPIGQEILLTAGSSFQRWNSTDGQPIGQPCSLLAGPGDEVTSVAFSRDWRLVASGHLDHKIRLWDITSQGGCRLFATLSGHSGLIWTLSFAERQGAGLPLISGGPGGDLILWEAAPVAQGFSVSLLRLSPKDEATLAVSRDGDLVAVGDSSGRLTLLDGKSRAKLDSRSSRNQRSIDRISFSQDGRFVATGGSEGTVLLWEVQQRRLVLRDLLTMNKYGSGDPIQSLAFSRDSSWLAAGTKDGNLAVWRFDEKNTPAWFVPHTHTGGVQALTFARESGLFSRALSSIGSNQKEYLISGGADKSLTLWDPKNGKRLQRIEFAHSLSIRGLAARADGLVASGSHDGSVRLWRIDGGLRSEEILFLGGIISDIALSASGELLAAAAEESSQSKIVLWDLKAVIPLGGEFKTPEKIGNVVFNPSGSSLYLAGKGGVTRWNLRPEAWSSRACDMVRRELSRIEQEKYLKPSEQPVVCDEVIR